MSAARAAARIATGARGPVVLGLVLLWAGLMALWQRLVLWPLVHLMPGRRVTLMSPFMRLTAGGILAVLRLGGARFERRGSLPTREPCLVLMIHQSLLDIPTAVVMARPHAPAFVTRKRYAHGVPLVSLCLRLRGSPIIDPVSDTRLATEEIASWVTRSAHSLVIFPEGHRSRDGRVRRFHFAGTESALRMRRVPVYLLVTDGFWKASRLSDFAWNLCAIRGRTELLGPYQPPDDEAEIPEFLRGLRGRLVEHLEAMRRDDGARA